MNGGQDVDLAELARACCAIARNAGTAIMQVYAQDFAVTEKSDHSPLTAADMAAHHTIVDGLRVLAPQIPVLSEESAEQAAWSVRKTWPRYFLVDPRVWRRYRSLRTGLAQGSARSR